MKKIAILGVLLVISTCILCGCGADKKQSENAPYIENFTFFDANGITAQTDGLLLDKGGENAVGIKFLISNRRDDNVSLRASDMKINGVSIDEENANIICCAVKAGKMDASFDVDLSVVMALYGIASIEELECDYFFENIDTGEIIAESGAVSIIARKAAVVTTSSGNLESYEGRKEVIIASGGNLVIFDPNA